MTVTRVERPHHATVRRVGREVREAIQTGQTRYEDLRAEVGLPDHVIDHALCELARRGEVALYPLGDVLRVEPVSKRE